MQPAKQFDLCPWNTLIAMPHMGWQHAGWLASYVVNAKRILEWGCGGSTLWMAMMCHGEITSVEHMEGWYNKVRDALCYTKPLRSAEVWLSLRKIADYVVDDLLVERSPYDLIFVDGKHDMRTPCLMAAYDLLAPGGVVFLDDSEEPAYQKGKQWLLKQPCMKLIDERADELRTNQKAMMWAVQKSESPA